MTEEKMLKKIIEKAVKGGWKPFGILRSVLNGEIFVGMKSIYSGMLGWNEYYIYLFDKEFARAYFGEEWGQDKSKYAFENDKQLWAYFKNKKPKSQASYPASNTLKFCPVLFSPKHHPCSPLSILHIKLVKLLN